MARSASSDPVDKFRFKVTVISLDLSVTSTLETIAGLSSGGTFFKKNLAIFSRAGFSSVDLPKANIGEMTYRENIDNLRSTKVPGLAKFTPVTFSRGVTSNTDMYDWYSLVNNEIALLAVAGQLDKNTQFAPTQSGNFRKDVIIESIDREGKSIKSWYLFNAWPKQYTPGNDLNSASEEKLIESLTLTYEFFIEVEGSAVNGFLRSIEQTAVEAVAGDALNKFSF